MSSRRRITIPKELLQESDISKAHEQRKKILFLLSEKEIVLEIDTGDWSNKKILGSSSIDVKGRVSIPLSIRIMPEEMMVYIENGVIKMRRAL